MRRIRVLAIACGLACATWSAHSPATMRAAWVPYGYVDAYVLRYPQSAWAIARGAAEFGVSYYWLERVAACESGLDPGATNASSGAAGLYQFMSPTFIAFARRLWWPRQTWLSPYNPWVAARTAAYAFSVGAWRQWSCR